MFDFTKKGLVLGAAVGCSSALLASDAQAALVLELSDGVTTMTVADGDLDDNNALPGVIEVSSSIGVFNINVATGFGSPTLGSPNLPFLDLNSVNFASTAAGSITVKLTQTDFTGPLPLADALLDAGGTSGGAVTVESFISTDNQPFVEGTLTGTVASGGVGDFSGDDSLNAIALTTPYSATIKATITHFTPGNISNIGATYSLVPEPSSLALLGMGALAMIRRRRG